MILHQHLPSCRNSRCTHRGLGRREQAQACVQPSIRWWGGGGNDWPEADGPAVDFFHTVASGPWCPCVGSEGRRHPATMWRHSCARRRGGPSDSFVPSVKRLHRPARGSRWLPSMRTTAAHPLPALSLLTSRLWDYALTSCERAQRVQAGQAHPARAPYLLFHARCLADKNVPKLVSAERACVAACAAA